MCIRDRQHTTHVYGPHLTPSSAIFIFLNKGPHTLRHSPKATGHSTQVRSSTSLLPLRKREASALEPVVAGVSEVGRRLRPRWTFLLWLIDFRAQRHRIAPGGGRRVRGGAAKERNSLRSNKRLRKLLDASRHNASWKACRFRGGPGYGSNVCPQPVGYYSSIATVYTAIHFFRSS